MNMNHTMPWDGSATLVDVLRARADCEPERDAFVFLRYRQAAQPEVEPLSYSSLLAQAQAVAGVLQQYCKRGDRVLILVPPGLNYITGG
jgi:acyl-CoA synthetase (AMP-forming)/AMP-acid ligase II